MWCFYCSHVNMCLGCWKLFVVAFALHTCYTHAHMCTICTYLLWATPILLRYKKESVIWQQFSTLTRMNVNLISIWYQSYAFQNKYYDRYTHPRIYHEEMFTITIYEVENIFYSVWLFYRVFPLGVAVIGDTFSVHNFCRPKFPSSVQKFKRNDLFKYSIQTLGKRLGAPV